MKLSTPLLGTAYSTTALAFSSSTSTSNNIGIGGCSIIEEKVIEDEPTHYIYNLRRYDAIRDHEALVDICKNVYGGYDYLPKIASSLAIDPQCDFMVLTAASDSNDDDDNNDKPVAVANVRKIKHNMSWLEAIRTCEKHRGRGLARHLTQCLINLSQQRSSDDHHRHREVYSCTVASNVPMQKVFRKVGMQKLGTIHQLSFAALKELPGWRKKNKAAAASNDDQVVMPTSPKPLLQSIGAENFIGETARNMKWDVVTSEEELNKILNRVKTDGGIGHLVGLYELLPDSAIRECLQHGRVWSLVVDDNDDDGSSSDSAVFALTRDEKISSLRSPWVCSVSATTNLAFESALWQACCTDRCLPLLLDDYGGATTAAAATFTVAFDGAIPIQDSVLADTLPLTDDACLLYGSSSLDII